MLSQTSKVRPSGCGVHPFMNTASGISSQGSGCPARTRQTCRRLSHGSARHPKCAGGIKGKARRCSRQPCERFDLPRPRVKAIDAVVGVQTHIHRTIRINSHVLGKMSVRPASDDFARYWCPSATVVPGKRLGGILYVAHALTSASRHGARLIRSQTKRQRAANGSMQPAAANRAIPPSSAPPAADDP